MNNTEPKLEVVEGSASRFRQLDLRAAADAYNEIVVAAQALEYLLEALPNKPTRDGFEPTREATLTALVRIVYHAKQALFA